MRLSDKSKLKKRTTQIGVGACKISKRQKSYVQKVLASNRITFGPMSQQFEKEFAALHKKRFAVFCNSGTSALRISIAALKEKYKWKDGDEIIIPALNFVADVNVLLQNNLTPVFVDVDPKFYTIDPAKIESAITPKTRAIIPVHLCGLPCEMDEIMAIAKKKKIPVIEDVCESLFVSYKGKPVGSFGDIACFSTYQAHILTTGVGGFALTDDPKLAELLRSLMNHGRDGIYITIDDDKVRDKEKLNEIVHRRFNFIRPGYSFRATEFEAALGLAALHDGIHTSIEKRNRVAAAFISHLKKYSTHLQLPKIPARSSHAFMMFPIVVKSDSITRDELVSFLEDHNIETRYILPLINQPYIKKLFGDLSKKYPVSHRINETGFYIGCHEHLSSTDTKYIQAVFDEFFRLKQIRA
ncbi:MAG: hypothetical protein A3B25_02195 [Candidatus Ryanbacteria bacterium RIFCSPLOWO2_01_FULL_48_26]|uniref:Aminotransferase DegT n=1 Tax=Candidatus Ryanbacteria bacterium RIFCSPLOWO2_01_FULL_48_26 TaxID=1802126 RepID=A0A1G2GUB6_9BACT|nr:MAG: hypothetical protein A3B25_02195 [Candidatus Ryanbacteria bacterium RIFCSPLOWO2_01_FULL_48_26]